MKKLISNNLVRKFRNFISFFPTPYYFPSKHHHNVSDFFFWTNENGYNTKFQLVNLSSNITPEDPVTESVKFFIYDEYTTWQYLDNAEQIITDKYGSDPSLHDKITALREYRYVRAMEAKFPYESMKDAAPVIDATSQEIKDKYRHLPMRR